MWDYRAQVTDIHDGDTITVLLDTGFSNRRVETALRLLDVYAPELSQPGGQECRNFVVTWIAHRNTGEWPFVCTTARIKSDAHEVTTLGRFVGTLTSGIESLNDAITEFIAANGFGGGIGTKP